MLEAHCLQLLYQELVDKAHRAPECLYETPDPISTTCPCVISHDVLPCVATCPLETHCKLAVSGLSDNMLGVAAKHAKFSAYILASRHAAGHTMAL
jgi:hypothetical protein